MKKFNDPIFSINTLSILATNILARLIVKCEARIEEAGRWLGNAAFATNYEFEFFDDSANSFDFDTVNF